MGGQVGPVWIGQSAPQWQASAGWRASSGEERGKRLVLCQHGRLFILLFLVSSHH